MTDDITDVDLDEIAQMYAGERPCALVVEIRRLRARVAELEDELNTTTNLLARAGARLASAARLRLGLRMLLSEDL